MFLLVQTIDFDSGKVASRDHPKEFAVVDDGQVPETSVVHGPQSIDRRVMRSERCRVLRRCFAKFRRGHVYDGGKHSYNIAAGEYSGQALVAIDHQGASAFASPHAAARLPNGLVFSKHQWLVAFDHLRQGSERSASSSRRDPILPMEFLEFHTLEIAA